METKYREGATTENMWWRLYLEEIAGPEVTEAVHASPDEESKGPPTEPDSRGKDGEAESAEE